MTRRGFFPHFAVSLLAFCVAGAFCFPHAQAQQSNSSHAAAGGLVHLNPGLPPVVIQPTVEMSQAARNEAKVAKGGTHGGGGSTNPNLYYNGGISGVGVEQPAVKVYLVYWGAQWGNGDPSGEMAILYNFFQLVGGSTWSNTDTQYCQNVPSGTYFCSGITGAVPASNNIVLAGSWVDNVQLAPSHPRQSQLAAEAVKAAAAFGNTTPASNANAQYIIATASGDNPQGFPRQYCAWHSYTTSSTAGNISYTNLPYITDAGASCGANFNGLGATAGITIVAGHEMSESITDPFPSGGWLDSNGLETGDKCAWIATGSQGAAANVTFTSSTNGQTYNYPVQSLWSNAFNSDAGGCVLSY